MRLVPGLGTRAVDRTRDDYPVLVVPQQPDLRVNVVADEVLRYAPRFLDVIDLEANDLVTLPVAQFLQRTGDGYPAFRLIFSLLRHDTLRRPLGPWQPDDGEPVVTFDGLRSDSRFFPQLAEIFAALEEGLEMPVDIEFAHDGEHLYLLQCRAQSCGSDEAPAPIPRDIPRGDIVFTANRHVANGWIPEITHIVYVDPEEYGALESREKLLAVGKAVGLLNRLLPKRQFVLMGPGRWGSRGDIKLGVSVTYADINNTAMLIEIARQRGRYTPEVSFGTHFFQDLVEAQIRYLPLYPDDDSVVFNEIFLRRSPNLLVDILPEYASLATTIRVIEVPRAAEGRVLRVLMNADLDEAVGVLVAPSEPLRSVPTIRTEPRGVRGEDHSRWRQQMAERIAAELDAEAYGVVALYLFGSVKNYNAGPGSDIDLLVHHRGGAQQRAALLNWLDGWSRALAEVNYMHTGYRCEQLLDIHVVTDEDIERKTSYASKIGAVTDAAQPL
jgi:predicted nucleotidyltransferase